MWLINSSVGRKFVMAITGVCLVLFVTFHVLMNAVALCWPAAYNSVCEFLGANWYALIASMGLALLFIIHIIYAVWLTFQNRAARGTDRYAVNAIQPQVEWSSKNMLVLGIVILAFLVVHLVNFWYKMQYQELMHHELSVLPQLDGVAVQPALGTLFLQMAFSTVWVPIVYIIGFIALWFHLNHGFWSMFQTIGWNNATWLPRLKCIAKWWTSIVVALFVAQAIVFTVQAHKNYYLTAPELQEQYAESWYAQAEKAFGDFQGKIEQAFAKYKNLDPSKMSMQEQMKAQEEMQKIQETLVTGPDAKKFVETMNAIEAGLAKQCPDVNTQENQQYMQANQMKMQIESMMKQYETPLSAIQAATPGAQPRQQEISEEDMQRAIEAAQQQAQTEQNQEPNNQ